MTFKTDDTLAIKWGEMLIGVIRFKGGSDMLQRSVRKAFPELLPPPNARSMATELQLSKVAAGESGMDVKETDKVSTGRDGTSVNDDTANAGSGHTAD